MVDLEQLIPVDSAENSIEMAQAGHGKVDPSKLERMPVYRSKLFERYRVLPALNNLVDSLWNDEVAPRIAESVARKRNWRSKRSFFRDLLYNLYDGLLRGGLSVSVDLHKGAYAPGTRNRKLHLKYADVKRVLDAAIEAEIVEVTRPGQWSSKKEFSRITELGLTDNSKKLLLSGLSTLDVPSKRMGRTGLVRLKDPNGSITEYKDSPQTKRWKDLLQHYNQMHIELEWEVVLGQLAQCSEKHLKVLLAWIPGLMKQIWRAMASEKKQNIQSQQQNTSLNSVEEYIYTSNTVQYTYTGASSGSFKHLEFLLEGLPGVISWLSGKNSSHEILRVPLCHEVYRVFHLGASSKVSDPSTWLCGRFVASYQVLSPEFRERLIANGKQLWERDFGAMFAHLAYHLNGLVPPEIAMYSLLEELPEEIDRDLSKRAVLIALSADGRDNCIKAIQQYINAVPTIHSAMRKHGWEAKEVCVRLEAAHAQIKQFFYRGYGLELMRYESDIAFRVLEHYANKGQVCLVVHDSFLAHDPVELGAIMQAAYAEVTGTFCPIH